MLLFIYVAASVVTFATGQILCPAQFGDFANPASEQCTTFFRCIQGTATMLRCPANQRFDFLFRICRPQRQVNCNNQLQVFAAPAVTPGLGALPGLGNLGGLGSQTGLGAGLPNNGLVSLLAQLDGDGDGDGDGQGGNNLALLAAVNIIRQQRQQRQQGGFSNPQRTNFINPATTQGRSPIITSTQQQQPQPQVPVGFLNGQTILVVPQQDQGGRQFQVLIPQGRQNTDQNPTSTAFGPTQINSVPDTRQKIASSLPQGQSGSTVQQIAVGGTQTQTPGQLLWTGPFSLAGTSGVDVDQGLLTNGAVSQQDQLRNLVQNVLASSSADAGGDQQGNGDTAGVAGSNNA